MPRRKTAAVAAMLGLAVLAAPARAENDGPRAELSSAYLDQYQQRNALYQSAPVTHIVPSLKTVTLALAMDRYDVKVTEPSLGGGNDDERDSLHLTGYRVEPYVAVSLKRIGLGFSAETGKRLAEFDEVRSASVQTSEADYKAIGVYAYWLPFETRGEQAIIASTVVGAKDYNVTHRVSPLNSRSASDAGSEKFRYNVNEYMVGSLVEFRLLKFFSLLPWIDYTYVDVHDPLAQAKSSDHGSGSTLEEDTGLFWLARPRVDFGLDLVLKTHGFAIHLGEAFGVLLAGNDNEMIADKTLSVSISQDLKGE